MLIATLSFERVALIRRETRITQNWYELGHVHKSESFSHPQLPWGSRSALPCAPRAENAKINVTYEPYFGTYIVCNYLPFSKAAKGAQGGPQQ